VSSPSSEGSVPVNWLLSKSLRAAAAEKRAQHSPPAAAFLSPHGTSKTGTHNKYTNVSAPISEGSVPLNWMLLYADLHAAAAKSALSTVLPPPPPSVHGTSRSTSRRGTHKYSNAVIAPSSEGSVPLNWLFTIGLRAAAAESSAQSSRRRHPQSMRPHRGALTTSPASSSRPALKGACRSTGCYPSPCVPPPLRSQHSPPAAASLSPCHLTEGHSPILQLRERAQL
jgi:hypothetical protein